MLHHHFTSNENEVDVNIEMKYVLYKYEIKDTHKWVFVGLIMNELVHF